MSLVLAFSSLQAFGFQSDDVTAEPCQHAPRSEDTSMEIAGTSTSQEVENSLGQLIETTDLSNAHLVDQSVAEPDAPEVAARVELFRFEKDYNPKNILHYGVQVNKPSCTIAKGTNGAPLFENYWIMGEAKGGKQLMTSRDKKNLGVIVLESDEHKVKFKMNAMNEFKLKKKVITVEAKIVDGKCKTFAFVELDDGRNMNLDKLYAKISTVLGIPSGVDSVTVYGSDQNSGANIQLKF